MKTKSKIVKWLSAALIIFNLSSFTVAQAIVPPIKIQPYISTAKTQWPIYFPYANTNTFSFNYGGIGSGAVINANVLDSNNAVKKTWQFLGKNMGTSGTQSFIWDGKASNNAVIPEGDYTLKVSGLNDAATTLGPISIAFSTSWASVATMSVSKNPYNPDTDGSLNLTYTVFGPQNEKINISIVPDPNPNNLLYASYQDYTAVANKPTNIVWAPAAGIPDGTYRIYFAIVGQMARSTTFQIARTPSLGVPTMSPAGDYNPTFGNVEFTSSLANVTTSATVNAGVYMNNDPVKTWTLANQTNGTKKFTWDGKNASNNYVANGQYTLKVWGTADNGNLATQQLTFVVNIPADPNPNPNPVANPCASFPDVDAASVDCPAITYAKSIGAITGTGNGNFDPSGNLQRDQIAKIALTTFKLFNANVTYCLSNPFSDVTNKEWSYQYICLGKSLNVITGYLSGADAGKYVPARSVNRVEFLALLLRNLKDQMPANSVSSYADVPVNQWYTGYAKYSFDHSLFSGNSLYPNNVVTRVEVAKVLYQLHNLGKI